MLAQVRPDVVVNCVGVIKQLGAAKDPLIAVPLNTLLPHRLARAAALVGARLVHVSTDCVFSGTIGNYTESMLPDADDLYGRSKLLGEVDYPNAITLRTSIIGREIGTRNGLVEWFLDALYDKVVPGGYVIVDDYILAGCRQAVDDFRECHGIRDQLYDVDGSAVFWRKA